MPAHRVERNPAHDLKARRFERGSQFGGREDVQEHLRNAAVVEELVAEFLLAPSASRVRWLAIQRRPSESCKLRHTL